MYPVEYNKLSKRVQQNILYLLHHNQQSYLLYKSEIPIYIYQKMNPLDKQKFVLILKDKLIEAQLIIKQI